jgi:(p)ppGpp synthase/HD superfamily hydrolase
MGSDVLPTRDDDELVALALDIATRAHAGQTDKSGAPYMGHPQRVADRLATPALKVVALLHDVLEDCDVTADDLADAGIPDDLIAGVVAMTKHEGETYEQSVARAADNPLARQVKAADMADNSDPQRLAQLPPETADRLRRKYELGRRLLQEHHSDQDAAPRS